MHTNVILTNKRRTHAQSNYTNKKAQLTQRERATGVHVWRPTANKCKIRKNLYFSKNLYFRSFKVIAFGVNRNPCM